LNPFFSIVIPTYNRAEVLPATIASVMRQTCGEFELIVVDDGSTDNTRDVVAGLISEYPSRSIRYEYQENAERGAARNRGARLAQGQFVVFLDSDDALYPGHLSVARVHIARHPDVAWLHLRYEVKTPDGKTLSVAPVFNGFPNRQLIEGNFLSCNAVFIRRDVAIANPFDEDRSLSAMEDWELWLRLAAKYPLHYVNTVTSVIINHDSRSVLVTDAQKLITRVRKLMEKVKGHGLLSGYFRRGRQRFLASCYSYVSLHLALTKAHRKKAAAYLLRAVLARPAFVFSRRFLAILKHLP
jgi:glycosyltransferase involved in cell wall biosynthesis